MKNTLDKEFKYYLDHQDELVGIYNGRVIVIKDKKVVGDFENELEAVTEMSKTYKPGSFLVQRCTPGDGEYSATFYSRVASV